MATMTAPRMTLLPKTERRRRFVELYLGETHFNATRAAALAGYAWPGKAGPRLLTFPDVGPLIKARFAEMMRREGGDCDCM